MLDRPTVFDNESKVWNYLKGYLEVKGRCFKGLEKDQNKNKTNGKGGK